MADEKPNQETEDENTAAADAKQPADDQVENAASDMLNIQMTAISSWTP